ncbi:hypothetical protein MES5069_270246 [Mesorhizobium escarrei]|uniref:Uncharacterized protein n=1 Tax=Mesorhizobium escarrei TaxID=666018 RepID=A0ABN8JSL5_9HYPH|nr:hypothetical protein MES5069_270246 [Mesorhizobium escarrei]
MVGGTESDVTAATPKIVIAERLIKGIRPWAEVLSARTTWRRLFALAAGASVRSSGSSADRASGNARRSGHRPALLAQMSGSGPVRKSMPTMTLSNCDVIQ